MTRISRFLPSLVLACSMAAPLLRAEDAKPAAEPATPATPAATDKPAAPDKPATPAGTPATPDATTPATTQPAGDQPATLSDAQKNQPLDNDVDDFWHYGKIANYPMAAEFGKKIIASQKTPEETLGYFEAVAIAHMDDLDDWMLRWEGVDASGMKDLAVSIQKILGTGRHSRRFSQKWIQENVEALDKGERAYRIHLSRLRESGEMVVPMMIDYLRDREAASLKDPIRRALIDLGRPILNPLLAATETTDHQLQLILVDILSEIGYDIAAPYLSRIAQDRTDPVLADAATSALRRMGVRPGGNIADQFYHLAEKFYYNAASIQVDAKAEHAYIWYWTGTGTYKDVPQGTYPSTRRPSDKYAGLTYKEVPPAIFSDIMAEREAEYALLLGPATRDALSLWLCANNKLEVDNGDKNPFEGERPGADFYNVYAGAQYLNAALTRVLNDRNPKDDTIPRVALKLIKSLGTIVGPSSQGSGVALDPLVEAMRYPDRIVRFEAAFALASGLPNTLFPGHERVAPLLAEAVAQTKKANVLIVASSQGDEQKMEADLKDFRVTGGITAQAAFANAPRLAAVDVIVFPETLAVGEIDRIYQLAASNSRFERAGKVIITQSKLSPWSQRMLTDPLTVVTQATDAEGLSKAIEDARKRAGGIPLPEEKSSEYAVRAAQMLQRLAEGHVTAFDLTATQQTLLASLNDERPEVVKAVGEALAYMNSRDIQFSMFSIASTDKTPKEVREALLHSLAKNVKFFGGHLLPESVDILQKMIDDPNVDQSVRTAAAEARGALNLPADQAKTLIVNQSKR